LIAMEHATTNNGRTALLLTAVAIGIFALSVIFIYFRA